ncbi:hypothetical protein SLEP1_g41005 [Rubroshorea leprosula]|uniref:Uncharacterized protein n=1 Tax=Rubroshorea leprosula TaxID=152421 RepID=A0AAV5L554_9ROSI|nr:hypothetical protein SLEP1_g41005 [Rubroshorea leprosula]
MVKNSKIHEKNCIFGKRIDDLLKKSEGQRPAEGYKVLPNSVPSGSDILPRFSFPKICFHIHEALDSFQLHHGIPCMEAASVSGFLRAKKKRRFGNSGFLLGLRGRGWLRC